MTDTPENPDASVDVQPPAAPERRDRSWIVLAVSIVFVIAVVGTFSYLMRTSFQPDAPHAYDVSFGDNFDRRSNDSGLGATATGEKWTSVAGLWAVDAGRAVLAYPDKTASIAIIGSVKYASIIANVSGQADCGLLARYVDPQNYIALVRAFKYGVWNLVEVQQGKETVVAKLPDLQDVGFTVKLETGRRVVTAYVGFKTASVVLPTSTTAAPVGFIAHGNEATACTWDDMLVSSGR